ncbi:hypothetical protein C5167_009398 [Papaver somniferum]|uniref:Trafficking protein particle complex subunit n=1 Tax=Papaver somniferum TaxID=3469 RepID=A0A4Y7K077_PAPSO|nr:hypothetical protein C5167_009398 [Papaver somniferum]
MAILFELSTSNHWQGSFVCCSFSYVTRCENIVITDKFFGGSEVSPSPPISSGAGNRAHMMYVFNRNGVCLLYREWNRPLRTLSSQHVLID